MTTRSPAAEAAHRYAGAGWSLFTAAQAPSCPPPEHGYFDATTGHPQISRWWPGAARREAAAGLAEELDVPGYWPWSRYRPSTGNATAPDFRPDHRLQPAREIA